MGRRSGLRSECLAFRLGFFWNIILLIRQPMRTLSTLLLITACSQVGPELEAKFPEEVQALEQSCDLQNGTFTQEVKRARICLGEQVKIVCSNPGYGEPKILSIN